MNAELTHSCKYGKFDRMEQTLGFGQGAMWPHCYDDANLSQLILLSQDDAFVVMRGIICENKTQYLGNQFKNSLKKYKQ